MPKIYYKKSGSGFPLILVHGFCETNYIWERFCEALSDEFHVICPDLPGFGLSPLSDTPFQLVDIADQLSEWLLSSGIRRCVVIGHSLGGYITLELVRRHRNLIAGFGLFNSSAFADSQEKKENRNKLIGFIKKEGVRPFITTFVPSLFHPPTAQNFEKEIEYIKKLGNTTSAETVTAYAAAMRDRKDNLDMLKQNSGMALLISGAEDRNVPVQAAREMAKLLNKDNVHILSESAHMSMFEKEAETIDIVRQFVRKIQIRE